MTEPPRFEDVYFPNNVSKLDKALYILKQAPRYWCDRLYKFLLDSGFNRCRIDNTLFLKSRGRNLFIVQVYVDDFIFGATTSFLCDEFAKLMSSEFEIRTMGELNFFHTMQIKKSTTSTTICQQKYIHQLLRRFHIKDAKPVDTPIETF